MRAKLWCKIIFCLLKLLILWILSKRSMPGESQKKIYKDLKDSPSREENTVI